MTAISQLPKAELEVLEIRLPAPYSSLFWFGRPLFWVLMAVVALGIFNFVGQQQRNHSLFGTLNNTFSAVYPFFVLLMFASQRAVAKFSASDFTKISRMPRPLAAGMNGPTLKQARCLFQS